MSLLPGAKRAEFKKPRQKNDWYTENRWASEQLFASLELTGPIHDPFCGEGRIVLAARAAGYIATGADIVDRGFPGTEIIDFLTDHRLRTTLVFNAAYRGQEHAIAHALKVAEEAVVVFVRIPFLCGQDRHWNFYRPHPPSLVLVCSERANGPPGGLGVPEKNGTADICWGVVWTRDKPRWRRCGGTVAHPEKGWLSPDSPLLDWLEPGLRLPQTRSAA